MKTHTAILLLGLTALAQVAPAQAQTARLAADSDTASNTVTVQNDRSTPVTIYLEYGRFDRRLGIVPALHTQKLPIPRTLVGQESVRLFAHPEGAAEDLASQEFELRPPARIGMIVPPQGGFVHHAHHMRAVIPPEEMAVATITVDNPRSVPVTVFAEHGEFDVRLGEVSANSRATLSFPKSVVGPGESIEIFVHPEGGEDLGSTTMQVREGEHLGLRVPLH